MTVAYGTLGRSGEFPGLGLPEFTGTAWTYVSAVPLSGAPTMDGDLLVVVDVNGGVHALDRATGRLRWLERNECGASEKSAGAAVAAGRVFSLEDEDIVARDRDTGRRLGVAGSGKYLTAVGRRLFVINGGAELCAIEADGRRVWEAAYDGGLLMAPPVIHGGLVIAAHGFEAHHTHGGVSAFDAGSGRLVWAARDEQQGCNVMPPDGAASKNDWLVPGELHAIVADGRVWVTRHRRHEDDVPHEGPWTSFELAGLDPADGTERWTWRMPPQRHSIAVHAPVAAGSLMFITCTSSEVDHATDSHWDRAGDITLIAIRTDAPESAWRHSLTGLPAGAPAITGGQLYLLTGEGMVQAISCATGEVMWTHHCGEGAGPLPGDSCYEEDPARLIPADGILYVQTATTVHALR